MDIRVRPKPAEELLDTPLLQQTDFWGRVKGRLGWRPAAFDIETDRGGAGDLLILTRELGGGRLLAYAPYGPELLPDSDRRGEYLAALSAELVPFLGAGCALIRWDLPWESPYADDEDRYDGDGNWLGPPEPRLRELRMNWGVDGTGLRKAPGDLLPPDTILVDLEGSEEELLARMKPKTRYNIRLAERKGVSVRRGGARDFELWNRLYRETARRNRIRAHGPEYFAPLMKGEESTVRMLIAEADGVALAAMFLSVSADRACYLYGASSDDGRDLMAPYALQWEAMRTARAALCRSYDLFGVSPRPDPEHPMYGLYRFKIGFGGRLLHRQGVWDYPYDEAAYGPYRAAETASQGFNI